MHRFTMPIACAALTIAATWNGVSAEPSATSDSNTLTLVVMDPLALPLSCPCVKGYAQRDYEKLGRFLSDKLGRPVSVAFSDSLVTALKEQTSGKADLVIGKKSVVLADAEQSKRKLTPVAMLTGKDGAVHQTGLIVVPSRDSAKSVADLAGYQIFFGPKECDEKHQAAMELLQKHQVPLPATILTCAACDEGAVRILEMEEGQHGAAVISSYAKPLLEGCGTVRKGDLRVVGETKPVPFVTAFLNADLDPALAAAIQAALLSIEDSGDLKQALETRDGFIAITGDAVAAKKKI